MKKEKEIKIGDIVWIKKNSQIGTVLKVINGTDGNVIKYEVTLICQCKESGVTFTIETGYGISNIFSSSDVSEANNKHKKQWAESVEKELVYIASMRKADKGIFESHAESFELLNKELHESLVTIRNYRFYYPLAFELCNIYHDQFQKFSENWLYRLCTFLHIITPIDFVKYGTLKENPEKVK